MGELSLNNSIAHLLSHASLRSSQLLSNLKANAYTAVSTGLTGLALTVAVVGASVTHSQMYDAGIDFYALEQPNEPVKASFESAASDRVKESEEYKAWFQLNQIESQLGDKIYAIEEEAKGRLQVKELYDSFDKISSLAAYYKEKVTRMAEARFDEKILAFNSACLSVFLGVVAIPYVSSLWMRKKQDTVF